MEPEPLQSSTHVVLSECPASCESQPPGLGPGAGPGLHSAWSHDSCCRATTSRKLSRSNGDCEQCGSACGSDCSCGSTYNVYAFSSEYYAKPCSIADSNTLLQKSRWRMFKSNFVSRFIKRKWSGKYSKYKSRKEDEEEFKQSFVIVDSRSGSVVKSSEGNSEIDKLKQNGMDVSQVQSGAKCGNSDFSIERILSEDRKEDSLHTPSWLCCTRYQPPRIPRASNSAPCRSRRSGRHARVPFTAAQAAALEAAYARAPYLAPPALRALAAALQLRDDRIKIWFQNRRARERREKCSTITPPQSMPLPPTTLPLGALLATGNNPWTDVAARSQPTPSMTVPFDFSDTSRPLSVNLLCRRSTSFADASQSERIENRPETPLDVETVDE